MPSPPLSEYLALLPPLLASLDLPLAVLPRLLLHLLTPSSSLPVPGATLRYSTTGTGPLLLLIPGANGDASIFLPLAAALAPHYTVCTYARRGFAPSPLSTPEPPADRLRADADDAAALIAHLAGPRSALVLGNSSGAVVALELLARHPARVRRVLLHEAPKMLADADAARGGEVLAGWARAREAYEAGGVEAGTAAFAASLGGGEGLEMRMLRVALRAPWKAADVRYWFERELCVYPNSAFDAGVLVREAERVEVLLGEETQAAVERGGEAPLAPPSYNMARLVGKEVVLVPGWHVGFAVKPSAFAQVLRRVLGE